jgi:hypothetical protein
MPKNHYSVRLAELGQWTKHGGWRLKKAWLWMRNWLIWSTGHQGPALVTRYVAQRTASQEKPLVLGVKYASSRRIYCLISYLIYSKLTKNINKKPRKHDVYGV